MTQTLLYSAAGIILFFTGLVGLFALDHLVRRILAVNIMGGGIFMVLLAFAQRTPDAPPDPVPHAMVLTGIVVTVSATALALMLAGRVFKETGSLRLPEETDEESAPRDGRKKQSTLVTKESKASQNGLNIFFKIIKAL